MHAPALTVALALAAGIVAQALARHVKIPGIVVLLATGVLLGPDLAGWIQPASLGGALIILVEFGVAVILFEGGLNLDIRRLRNERRSIRQLVTVGALVTAIGGTLAARLFLGWRWRDSALFGTLVIVTGPTVVTPLLRRLKVQQPVTTVLEAEGVLIDAVGAVIAALALEVALSPSSETLAIGLAQLAARLGFGLAAGLIGGALLALVLRVRNLVPEGLENIFALCLALALFHVANAVIDESGIAAVTVAGLVVGNARTLVHHDLLEFKEQLTVMLIGMLFVLLAADVRLAEVQALGLPGVLTVASLIFIVRPLNVLVGTWGTDLDVRQKLFIAWMAPRGIVAAAIASLFVSELTHNGLTGGTQLRAMVFFVIAATVVVAGTTGGLVARLLHLRQQARGWLLLGAHPLGRALACALVDGNEDVVCIDTNPQACQAASSENLEVIQGNALEDSTLEHAQIDTRIGAIGLSSNEEVNLLFAQTVKREAKHARLCVALRQSSDTVTAELVRRAGVEVLFGQPEDIDFWSVRLRRRLARTERYRLAVAKDATRREDSTVHAIRGLYLPLVVRRAKTVEPVTDTTRFREDDVATFVVDSERSQEARDRLSQLGWHPMASESEPRSAVERSSPNTDYNRR